MKIIGIDLGTTFSLVAEFNPHTGNVTVIPDESGGFVVPSAVYYPESGPPIVGHEAINAGQYAVDRVVRFIKTTIGSDYRWKIGSRDYTPAEISAEILKRLRQNAEGFLNVGSDDFASVVIAVPAYFGDAACAATLEAARLAGFNMDRVRLFPEPCAAALAYLEEARTELGANPLRILVSDLGGLTYDATVISTNPWSAPGGRTHLKLDVVCKGGSRELGGELWDDVLEDYVKERCAATGGHSPPDWANPDILNYLRERVVRGKESLSWRSSAKIACCPGNFQEISRTTFEEKTAALFGQVEARLRAVLDDDRTQQLEKVLKGERLKVAAPDFVLLAGGASKMPHIRAVVRDVTGSEPLIHRSLEQVVAIGAAYEAAITGEAQAMPASSLFAIGHSQSILLDAVDDLRIKSSPASEDIERRAVQSALEQAAKELGTHPSALYRWLKYPITQGEPKYQEPTPCPTPAAALGAEPDASNRQTEPGEPIWNEPRSDSNSPDQIQPHVDESTEQLETNDPSLPRQSTFEPLEFKKVEPIEMLEIQQLEFKPIEIRAEMQQVEFKPLESLELRPIVLRQNVLHEYNASAAVHSGHPIQPIEATIEAPTALDQVQFSVTAPPMVRARAKFLVDVWAHLEAEYDRIIELARDSAPSESIQIRSVDPVPLSRGTSLSVQLAIEGMTVEPEHNTILWVGKIGRAPFLLSAPFRLWSRTSAGSARIYVSGLEIARIQFVVKIGWTSVKPERIPCRIEQHRKAFASYSSEDRDQVLARIQGLQKGLPSLEVFLDVLKLRSGQDWQQELWSVIPTHDVFYLFWSANASNSEWVEKEWRCALKTRGLNFIDPVPLCTPELAPPPTELAGKHFNDWVLAFMRNPPPGGTKL